ncbi:MAG TPA: methyltransferase domain-containing protein, partial [Candidatus Omnitrophota bacterium]|nr:methyltransferase domain-containing protein [Candidatus Omnitrophota bacterium]
MSQTLNCPLCHTRIDEKEFCRQYFQPFNRQTYKLYYCAACDLNFWSPLKLVPEIYEQEVFQAYANIHKGEDRALKPHHRAFFDLSRNAPGRVLDIGCGNGAFIRHLQRMGFDVWGIDLDPRSIA